MHSKNQNLFKYQSKSYPEMMEEDEEEEEKEQCFNLQGFNRGPLN